MGTMEILKHLLVINAIPNAQLAQDLQMGNANPALQAMSYHKLFA